MFPAEEEAKQGSPSPSYGDDSFVKPQNAYQGVPMCIILSTLDKPYIMGVKLTM